MHPVELYPGLDRGCFALCGITPKRTVFRVARKAFQQELDVCVEGIQGDYTADVSQEERYREGEVKQSKLDIISRETANKSH